MSTPNSTKTIDRRELLRKMRELDPLGIDRDVMKLERESLKNAPDPGSPPYCPTCGGNKIAAPRAGSHSGVCVGCASIVRPEISVGGEVKPFLFRESELRVHPKEILLLREQVMAQIASGT
jgi:hypothetical protein